MRPDARLMHLRHHSPQHHSCLMPHASCPTRHDSTQPQRAPVARPAFPRPWRQAAKCAPGKPRHRPEACIRTVPVPVAAVSHPRCCCVAHRPPGRRRGPRHAGLPRHRRPDRTHLPRPPMTAPPASVYGHRLEHADQVRSVRLTEDSAGRRDNCLLSRHAVGADLLIGFARLARVPACVCTLTVT